MAIPKYLAGYLALCIGCALTFTGCAGDSQTVDNPNNVNFGLGSSDNADPADDNQAKPLYENDGQYTYQLDPVTLERISGPLDPESKEPVDPTTDDSTVPEPPDVLAGTGIEDAQYSDGIGAPVTEPSPDVLSPVEPEPEDDFTENKEPVDTSKPTPYTKLPNTGIFEEDD